MHLGDRDAIGAPFVHDPELVADMPVVDWHLIADLEGGEAIDPELLVDQEERVEQLRLLLIVHLDELFRIRKSVGELFADADDRAFVDPVNVEGNPVGLPEAERLERSLPSRHRATSSWLGDAAISSSAFDAAMAASRP